MTIHQQSSPKTIIYQQNFPAILLDGSNEEKKIGLVQPDDFKGGLTIQAKHDDNKQQPLSERGCVGIKNPTFLTDSTKDKDDTRYHDLHTRLTPMGWAIEVKDFARITSLHKQNPRLIDEFCSWKDITAFEYALTCQNADTILHFIKLKPDIDFEKLPNKNNNFYSIIHTSAKSGNLELAKRYISNKEKHECSFSDIKKTINSIFCGELPLNLAYDNFFRVHADLFEFGDDFFEFGDDFTEDKDDFFNVKNSSSDDQNGFSRAVNSLFTTGGSSTNSEDSSTDSEDSSTDYEDSLAESEDSISLINYLLENGADISKADMNDDTFLHKYLRSPSIKIKERIEELIIKYNPNIHQMNFNGKTALELAIEYDDKKLQAHISALAQKNSNSTVDLEQLLLSSNIEEPTSSKNKVQFNI